MERITRLVDALCGRNPRRNAGDRADKRSQALLRALAWIPERDAHHWLALAAARNWLQCRVGICDGTSTVMKAVLAAGVREIPSLVFDNALLPAISLPLETEVEVAETSRGCDLNPIDPLSARKDR